MRVGWDADSMPYFEWNARLAREHYHVQDGQSPQASPATRPARPASGPADGTAPRGR
jgi:hypothetical protein